MESEVNASRIRKGSRKVLVSPFRSTSKTSKLFYIDVYVWLAAGVLREMESQPVIREIQIGFKPMLNPLSTLSVIPENTD